MAKFPMAGDRRNVPILFSWSQAPALFPGRNFFEIFAASLILKRHPEPESRLFRRRCHVDPSTMGARDFGGDIEPQSQALPGALLGQPIERLKQPVHRLRRDRLPGIGDRQLEFTVARGGAHMDRPFGRAVSHRIAEQVGKQLCDAPAVAFDRLRQIEHLFDVPPG
jgi:hypothetical protein